jgi:hypothetical protein
VPLGGSCCDRCEHTFQEQLAGVALRRWWLAGFGAAWPLFALLVGPVQQRWRVRAWIWNGTSVGVAVVEALAMTVVIGALLAGALVQARVRWQRRTFLQQ